MAARREGPRSSIADVARQAGVSTATVSRVLNQNPSVSAVLRERVNRVVSALGYVPDAGARALKLQRSGTVGAVFPTVDNAIFAQAIDALQRRLAESGRHLILATCGYDAEAEARAAVNLVTRGADALALCGIGQSPGLRQFLRQRELPTVHVMSVPAPADMVAVGFDNARAVAQGVRYLVDLGHRRIAMLAGLTAHNDRASTRVAGVRQALAEAGLTLPAKRLVERSYALADAREGFRTLMAVRPAPTAVVCGNDVLAYGALLEAQRMRLPVPQQLSIVGFDDLELSRHLQPPLTTLHVPTELMWRTAAERLLDALEQRAVAPSTEFEVQLVVRESTGRAPRG